MNKFVDTVDVVAEVIGDLVNFPLEIGIIVTFNPSFDYAAQLARMKRLQSI
jgi:hypothetical protein